MSVVGFALVYLFGFSVEDFVAGIVPLLLCLVIFNLVLKYNPNR